MYFSSPEEPNRKQSMKRQKVFFNDLLALALAGIVSLLFTHGITQFVNFSKKHEQSPVSISMSVVQEEEDKTEEMKSSDDVGSTVIYNQQYNLFVHEKSFKLLRQVTFDIVWDWKRIKLPKVHTTNQSYNSYRDISIYSIPITLCKLLI
jgi:hypothetical protein